MTKNLGQYPAINEIGRARQASRRLVRCPTPSGEPGGVEQGDSLCRPLPTLVPRATLRGVAINEIGRALLPGEPGQFHL